MKKTIILGLAAVLVLGLSGCGKEEKRASVEEDRVNDTEVVENKTIVEWLKAGKSVECTIDSPEGPIITTTKNEAVRMEGIPYFSMESSDSAPEAVNGVMLTVGDWMYTWDKVSKQGTKMNVKEIERLSGVEDETAEEPESWDDMAEEWDESGFAYSCQEVNVDDELFEEPQDVEFTDLTEMMRGYTEMSTQMEEQMRGGEPMDMAEIEAMMQDMQ